MIQMKNLDRYEREILGAYEKGALVSARPTKAQLAAFREAARATFVKNKRVNIRLSAADLMDLQARAYEEGVPYQTLIASVLHKYVSGRLRETKSRLTAHSTRTRAKSARAGGETVKQELEFWSKVDSMRDRGLRTRRAD